MKYSQIVPAVIPKSQAEVFEMATALHFSREFHLDIVDGIFVPTSSWPYEPLGEPMAVKPVLDAYTLEVDLMVAEPIAAATRWVAAGADMLVFHVETISLEVFKTFVEQTVASIGVSCSGETPIETLLEYAQYADYVQLMGIHQIGYQGQPFDEAVFEKIATVKNKFPALSITIDGSVNASTIKRLKKAGADRFICGSEIVKQINPEAAHEALMALIND
ncbi:MAG: hypothetical protein RLZZ230_74 [Candidatus Parcubacteria bacterium]|jgi:ribulose-phosphate 3-epimerase